jgi:glycyl-tRNA synthetase alpha subunit
MPSSGTLRRITIIKTDPSEESRASIIRVKRIGELGTTLAITSHRRTLRSNSICKVWKRYVFPKRRFLQESYGVTSQRVTFFIVTVVSTSNIMDLYLFHLKYLEEF